jgi:diguanylate cyclase (GGDEF)-like protein
MRLPKLGFRSQIAIAFAILAVMLSAALGLIAGKRAGTELSESLGQSLADRAQDLAGTLDRDMAARAAEISLLAGLETLRRPNDPTAIRALLDRLKSQVPLYSWIGFVGEDGRVVAATGGLLEGADISTRPVFTEGRKGLFLGDVHEAVLLANLLPNPSGEDMKFVDVAMPVFDAEGRRIGVLASHLSWAWAAETAQALMAPIAAKRRIDLFIVGADRMVILGQGGLAAGSRLDLASLRDGQAGRHGWRIESWPDGHDHLTGHSPTYGYQRNPGLGWTVLARQPVAEAFAPVRALTLEILAWGCLLALVFAGLGWGAAARMAAPVAMIADAADRIRQGLSDRLPPIVGPVEIERLTASLRALIGSLTRKDEAIGQLIDRVHHDALTGAYNRAGFEDCAAQAGEAARSEGGAIACLYLDLDGFKGVNDRLGHAAGDQVLVEVARRLTVGLREGDVVARLGGDEFAMLLPLKESGSRGEVDRVASRIVAEICQPMATTEGEAQVGCSIGAALWRVQDGDIAAALQRADDALYAAKRAGGRRMVYDPALLAAD